MSNHAIALHNRIGQLERRLRWFLIVLLAQPMVMAALVLGGSTSPAANTIDASRFQLRDQDGVVRGALYMSRYDEACFTLMDENGFARAGFWVDEAGKSSFWGFDAAPSDTKKQGAGALVAQELSFELVTQTDEFWEFACRVDLLNDHHLPVTGSLQISLVDSAGKILGSKMHHVELGAFEATNWHGLIRLSPEDGAAVERLVIASNR